MKKAILLLLICLLALSSMAPAIQAHNYQQTKPEYDPHDPWFTVWYRLYSSNTAYWENTQMKMGYATVSQSTDPQWRATVDIYSYVSGDYYWKGGRTSPWQHWYDTTNPYSWTSDTFSIRSRRYYTRVFGKFEAQQCGPWGCGTTYISGWSQYPSTNNVTSDGHNHLSLFVDANIW